MSDLSARIKAARRIAEIHGQELFGYHLRPDGTLVPYTRPKGLGRVLQDALLATVDRPLSRLGDRHVIVDDLAPINAPIPPQGQLL